MSEKKIYFNSNGLQIEGLFGEAPGERGAVIAHPHPLHGGDMNNYIVNAACRVYCESGYSTLRFNFRGVGESGGSYDNGISEQYDVKAALDYLSNQGKKKIDLIGYSFGAYVNAMGIETFDKADRLIMISPPVSAMDCTFFKYNPKINFVVTGSMDEIAESGAIKNMLPVWNPEAVFKIIEGADHFYSGRTAELKEVLDNFLKTNA